MRKQISFGLLALALGLIPAAHAATYQHGGIVSHGGVGYLGIDVRDVSDDQVQTLKLKDARGAEIIRVDHDGPAGKMGLREHDVVMQMNGLAIDGEESIRRMLRETAPGHTVALVISRDGQQITLTAQMADRTEVERMAWEQHLAMPAAPSTQAPLTTMPSDDPATPPNPQLTASPAAPAKYSKGFLGTLLMTPSYTGVTLERIGPQLAQFFGVARGSGLLVKSVENNSPAAMAGIRAGDVVERADARIVVTMTDWTKAIRVAKGRPVSVVILRDHQERTLSLMPDAKKHS
jgi:serine protease Do